jgi:hypothetical protein
VRLQSRGHILTGGPRERHFDLFKRWAACHTATLARVCADGATLYGEWLYAKHTVFYDQLPHYFLEFDLRDRDGQFWSTARRTAHLAACGAAAVVRQVPVVWARRRRRSRRAAGAGRAVVVQVAALARRAGRGGGGADVVPETAARETDPADHGEGLYLKVEDADHVLARYKWVRASFLTSVLDSGSHWLARPIVPNQLAADVDLFAPGPP